MLAQENILCICILSGDLINTASSFRSCLNEPFANIYLFFTRYLDLRYSLAAVVLSPSFTRET